jgi:cytochrome c peroxidase
LIISLGGVNEAAITQGPGQPLRRIALGHRPGAMAVSRDGKVAYIANCLDDTVSLIEIDSGRNAASIALGPSPELSLADRGERLFFDARLSHDRWMSCHSCHTDGHTNNLASDTLGDGSYGAPKRIPSLLGVARTGPWTWTGSMSRLEDQVQKSILTTMHGTKPTIEQLADLTAFLNSLELPSPATTSIGKPESQAVARGLSVFGARKCAACHVPPEYTSASNYDVGLIDEVGNRQFNPPSLRGVSKRDTLLHDGRVRSLDEVFRKVRHPRDLVLTPAEIADLAAFLESL